MTVLVSSLMVPTEMGMMLSNHDLNCVYPVFVM